MGQRVTDLIHEPVHQAILEELEEIKELLDKRIPITWLSDILTEELWSEGDFQGGDTPLPPILATVCQQLNHFLGHSQWAGGRTIRE